MPSYTVYAATNDHHVTSINSSFATANSGSGLTDTDTTQLILQSSLSGGNYGISQAYLAFAVGTPAAGTISGVQLVANATTTSGTITLEVREKAFVSGTSAWVAGGSLSGYTQFGSSLTTSTTGVKTVTSSRTSLPSQLDLLIHPVRQRTGSAPAGVEQVRFSSADTSGTTDDPRLEYTVTPVITHYTLTASAGSFSLTGQAATLRAGRRVAASSGVFALTGQDATLVYDAALPTLNAEAGAFSVTGSAATLRVGRVLSAGAGSFALTGEDAALIYAALPAHYTLTAEAGEFVLTGGDASLTHAELDGLIITGGPWRSGLTIVGEARSSLTITGGPWASDITIAG